jgi:hypothetical protein
MIDWVMPPQTVVALIFIGWEVLLRKESFYSSDSLILLELGVHWSDWSGPLVRLVWPLPDRLQDAPPVRSLQDTSLTDGVSLIGLVPNSSANEEKRKQKRNDQRNSNKRSKAKQRQRARSHER